MTTLHLLRHAQPLPPTQPTSDVALSKAGTADARAIEPILQSLNIQRIVSSPYRRAKETVQPFAVEAGIRVETDVRLRERDMPLAENPKTHVEHVRLSFADADYRPGSGETFRETTVRAMECVQQLLEETPSGLLLVGHGQCLTLVLSAMNKKANFDFWRSLPMPAIVELTFDEGVVRGAYHLVGNT